MPRQYRNAVVPVKRTVVTHGRAHTRTYYVLASPKRQAAVKSKALKARAAPSSKKSKERSKTASAPKRATGRSAGTKAKIPPPAAKARAEAERKAKVKALRERAARAKTKTRAAPPLDPQNSTAILDYGHPRRTVNLDASTFKTPGAYNRTVEGVEAIGHVHQVPITNHVIPMRGTAKSNNGLGKSEGVFLFLDNRPHGIRIREQEESHRVVEETVHGEGFVMHRQHEVPRGTFQTEGVHAVHEYGHYLDMTLGNSAKARNTGAFASESSAELARAFRENPAYARWERQWRDSHPAYHAYNTDQTEMFARAYTQFVIRRSGYSRINAAFDRMHNAENASETSRHWNDSEWPPIERAMERHLRSHGLL